MRVPPVGETVPHLAWLPPHAASLVVLARAPRATVWTRVKTDPGAVLLLARLAAAQTLPAYFSTLVRDPAVLDSALHFLAADDLRFPDWNAAPAADILLQGFRYARLAESLARCTGLCDPENAWCCGLLAPLGWLAVVVMDPAAVQHVLADPAHASQPAATEQAHWGHDQSALARRLARRWHLPGWLTAVAGHLGLPAELAQQLGADPGLFRVTQLAVALVQQRLTAAREESAECVNLRLPVGADPAEMAATLRIPSAELAELVASALNHEPQAATERPTQSPDTVPLLRELLCLAAEHRGCAGASLTEAEKAIDVLQRALAEQRAGEEGRLHARKLDALAELAAGAGHEINNPLAVISGRAQYLLKQLTLPEPSSECPEQSEQRRVTVENSLRTIIQQAQRIHQTLRDLRQFARPSTPHKQRLDLGALAVETCAGLEPLAAERSVRLEIVADEGWQWTGGRDSEPPPPSARATLVADRAQVGTMLASLVRNALEAAPAEGWVRVRLETDAVEQVAVVVEDSGPGVAAEVREHLFDPFYSGRQAGRGRGLGLPTAWRLAQEHGGDVRFVPLPDGPTRFVLSLPRGGIPCAERNGHNGHPTPADRCPCPEGEWGASTPC